MPTMHPTQPPFACGSRVRWSLTLSLSLRHNADDAIVVVDSDHTDTIIGVYLYRAWIKADLTAESI